MMSMTLTGSKKLERRLRKLPRNIQRNLARKSMRKAMALLRKDARSRAPVRTGRLRKAIKSTVSIKAKTGAITGRAFVSYKRGSTGAPYAHLVEWGGTNNKRSRFMTQTFDANKQKVILEFRKVLIQEIAKVKLK